MSAPKRFQDQQLRSAHFYNEVWVVCPACKQKAIAKVDYEAASARLTCISCGYHKEVSTRISATARLVTAAHVYFDAELWLKSHSGINMCFLLLTKNTCCTLKHILQQVYGNIKTGLTLHCSKNCPAFIMKQKTGKTCCS